MSIAINSKVILWSGVQFNFDSLFFLKTSIYQVQKSMYTMSQLKRCTNWHSTTKQL